jgi:3-oxoacyl-[acyl-carrier protein] reductase
MTDKFRALVFGSTGAIGSAISSHFSSQNWNVFAVSRSGGGKGAFRHVAYDPLSVTPNLAPLLDTGGAFDAVCWAQGRNAADNVHNVDLEEHMAIYQANCLYIVATLKTLLEHRLLAEQARLCVVSSVWQNLARQDKLSYCMSKAALQGLVMSASADLAKEGILINAILPGALDTPMTHSNVGPEQLRKLQSATYFNKLPTVEDVAKLAYFLCSEQNTGTTGQFISVDLGFSHVRLL